MRKIIKKRASPWRLVLALPLSSAGLLISLCFFLMSAWLAVMVANVYFPALPTLPTKQALAIGVILLITVASALFCVWNAVRIIRRALQETGVLSQTVEVFDRAEAAKVIEDFITDRYPFGGEIDLLLAQESDDDPLLKHVIGDFSRILDDYEQYAQKDGQLRPKDLEHLHQLIAMLRSDES